MSDVRFKLIKITGVYTITECDGSENPRFTFATLAEAEEAKEIAYSGLGELDFACYDLRKPVRDIGHVHSERRDVNRSITHQLKRSK